MKNTANRNKKRLNRREFLKTSGFAAALGTLGLGVKPVKTAAFPGRKTSSPQKEKIKEVRAFIVKKDDTNDAYSVKKDESWTNTTLIASPMSVYPEYHDDRGSWGKNVLGHLIVEIEDYAGRIGVGVSSCGVPGAYLVEHHFKRFLVDEYAYDIEKIWDQMWLSSMHYGQKGIPVMAIAAVDLALWDLLGNQRQEPVYAMIGGQVKSEIHLYATTPNPAYAKKMGFWGAKMPLSYGPGDGKEGLLNNVRIAAKAREEAGDDFDLMYDCWMALNVPYTIELARALEPVRIKWLEEFLPPYDYDGLVDVRNAVKSCLLTTGEHEYTRFGFLEILKRRCIDILQPDITWCGGFSEALKIANLAKAYNVSVVPHVSSMYSYHYAISQTNCPFSEFIIRGAEGNEIVPTMGNLFEDEPLPVNGRIKVADKPGWGMTLNRKELNLARPFPV